MCKFITFLFLIIFPNTVFAQLEIYSDKSLPIKGLYIPEKARPNYETLVHYILKYQAMYLLNDRYEIKGNKNTYKFKFELNKEENKDLKKKITDQMQVTALESYILFENDAIVIDELSPENRFGKYISNETNFYSRSVGKTAVSYLMGHAICMGYIPSIDHIINDWPLIENTLYHNQKIIDLLNMSAGDQDYVIWHKGLLSTGRWSNSHKIKSFAETELKNSKKSSYQYYNYNEVVTNVLASYIVHKSKGDFQKILNETFQKNVKISNNFYLFKHEACKDDEGCPMGNFVATRYDYIRFAKAMLDDWKNDTCVGKYLKSTYDRRIQKNDRTRDGQTSFSFPQGYGSQSHFDYPGMKERHILGMDGYGGQSVLIDFDKSRIVSVHAIHRDYDWFSIVYDEIKNRK
jgi:hypothetical protein